MTAPLMTKDRITKSCLNHVADAGLTKKKDQEVLARAWGSLLALSEFMGDLDLLPVCTQMSAGIRERLSKKGEKQYVAWVERKTAEEQALATPPGAAQAVLNRAA